MRRAIETVPKDGKVVILEDDASGTFELAHWSAEARAWVKENGELSKITPTYWHATRRDEYLLQEGDEFLLQKESGSSGPSASRERRSLPFPSGRAAPQRAPAAGDGIALLGEVAKADPFTVARLEARAALGKAGRGPSAWRQFAVSSIAAAMVAASLIGLYFRAEITAYVTRYTGEQDTVGIGTVGVQVAEQETQIPSQDSQKADSLARDPALHQQAEADRASSQAARSDTAQAKQGADAMPPETQQPLEKERRRAEALASELARAQQVIETQVALASKTGDEAAQLKRLKQAAESATAQLQQSLQKEHDRAEALASELARAQREIETQVALASKTGDEAAQLKQLKQAAESAAAELRQSLKKEHDRAEALASELARAQRDIETQVALSSKTGEEAAQFKRTAESATAELRQSPQQERDRAEVLAPGRVSTQSTIGARIAVERASNSQIAEVTQAAEAAATGQPAATEAQGSPEAARLLARASALLGQGNIGAARMVLERAAETGSVQASFMLAETYDPLVLSTWRTYGTRGDATKARELYAKAYAGGIQEAKDRSDALR